MTISFVDIQRYDIEYRKRLFNEWRALLDERSDLQSTTVTLGARVIGGANPRGAAQLVWDDTLIRLVEILLLVVTDHPIHPQYLKLVEWTSIPADSFRWTALPGADWDQRLDRPVLAPRSQLDANLQVDGTLGAPELEAAPDEFRLATMYGILEREGQRDPTREKRWTEATALADAEFRRFTTDENPLYRKVLKFLVPEGANDVVNRIRAEDLAGVTETLAKDGVNAHTNYLKPRVEEALKSRNGSKDGPATPFGGGTKPSWIDIDLPDLEAEADLDIVEDNLMAMQAIYFAATLEDLKFFEVMDKILELFNLGVLPFGKGNAGDKIYTYWKRNFDRFTEVERRNLYARALGRPGGEAAQGTPNRQFNDLWLRFISSVSEWRRQFKVDRLLRAEVPFVISEQQVQKSARDLASNLSLFGYGVAYFAATELQQQIGDVIDILDDDEVKGAYGARDIWQVIDQVATLELSGARNSVRHRTMANSGAVIIRWLAKNARRISLNTYDPLLRPEDLKPPTNVHRPSPLHDPLTFDLIEACEQWLAVTGTPELRVEEFSQPSVGPEYTSRPVQIPGAARDVFESVGFNPADFRLN